MNKKELNSKDTELRKRLNIFLVFSMGALYALYRFVLVPLYSSYSNDIQYMNTVLPMIMQTLYQISEIIAISIGYAVTVYSVYRYGMNNTTPTFVIFSAVTVLQLFAGYLMSFSGEIGIIDMAVLFLPMALMLLQYFIVVLIASKTFERYGEMLKRKNNSARVLGENVSDSDVGVYPFKSVFDKTNPMIHVSFWGAVVVLVTSIVNILPSFVIYSIRYSYVFWNMLIERTVVSLLLCVICYFVTVYMLMLFFEKKIKRELYDEK